jgi:hypothetical protein
MIAGVGETSVVYIRADTGVKGPGEILKPAKPIVVGGFTRESNKDLALRMALDLLGVPYRYVTGYAGEADLRLAVQRGEINYTSEGLTGYTMGGCNDGAGRCCGADLSGRLGRSRWRDRSRSARRPADIQGILSSGEENGFSGPFGRSL